MAVPRIVACASPGRRAKPRQTVHPQFAMENGERYLNRRAVDYAGVVEAD
jgi:hypothetical protein